MSRTSDAEQLLCSHSNAFCKRQVAETNKITLTRQKLVGQRNSHRFCDLYRRIAQIPLEFTWIVQPPLKKKRTHSPGIHTDRVTGPRQKGLCGYPRNSHGLCNFYKEDCVDTRSSHGLHTDTLGTHMHYLQLQTFKEQVTRAASKMHRYPQETQEHFRNRPFGRPCPSIVRGTFCIAKHLMSCIRYINIHARCPSKPARWTCENEAFVQPPSKTATSTSSNKAFVQECPIFLCAVRLFLLWDVFAVMFFVVRLLCWEMMWVFFCCETPYWPHCETSLLWNSVPRNTTRLLNFFWKLKIIVAKVTGLILPTPERVVPIYTKAATCTTLSLHSWLCASWPH